MNTNKKAQGLRLLILFGLLAYITYEAYMHQVLGGGRVPSIHALCPLGPIESLYALFFTGSFIKKIYSGTVVLLVLTVVMTIIFRRSFCGLLCPFGALQEFFGRLGKQFFGKKKPKIPSQWDNALRYLKYLIFVLTIGMAWHTASLWISPFDPYTAYAHLSVISESIKEEPLAVLGFVLLGITVIGSFVYDRFFCKYLCPAGAMYALVGKFSLTHIERNQTLCVHCKACDKACPVDLKVEQMHKVTAMECINCNECVTQCPQKGALEIKTLSYTAQPVIVLLLVAGIFFGTITMAQATGNYELLPKELKSGEKMLLSEAKGYMSIEEAATLSGLSLKEVYVKLDIPEKAGKTSKLKEIYKEVPEYNFDAAKAALALKEKN